MATSSRWELLPTGPLYASLLRSILPDRPYGAQQRAALGSGSVRNEAAKPRSGRSLQDCVRRRWNRFDSVDALARDDAVRAVVLTGSGRGFCVGQDLREHAESLQAAAQAGAGSRGPLETVTEHYNPIVAGLAGMPKPVVAAVNGMAAGAGAGFAFACDFRLASSQAGFLIAFANVGLSLDSGVSWTLPRLVGSARATALCLLAEPIAADAALEMGLVSAVVEPERLLPAAQELAERLAAGPTAAYAAIKRSLAFAATSTLEQSLGLEAELQAAMGATADHRNATAAFLAKQQPVFEGR